MDENDFIAAACTNSINRTILSRLPALALNDVWLVSGSVFQTVWNVITRRDAQYGIRDYDLFYFDANTSFEAEDAVIKRAEKLFADLPASIELRNQARVHLWYPEKHGVPYPALSRATEGIDRFLMKTAQVGIRSDGVTCDVYAPAGLDDVAQMIVRPNLTPNFIAARYEEKALRWKSLWPELTILPAN